MDSKAAIETLTLVIAEMERRYQLLSDLGVSHIDEYNLQLANQSRGGVDSERQHRRSSLSLDGEFDRVGTRPIEAVQRYPAPAKMPGPKCAIGWVREHIACLHNFATCVVEDRPASHLALALDRGACGSCEYATSHTDPGPSNLADHPVARVENIGRDADSAARGSLAAPAAANRTIPSRLRGRVRGPSTPASGEPLRTEEVRCSGRDRPRQGRKAEEGRGEKKRPGDENLFAPFFHGGDFALGDHGPRNR